MLYRKISNDIMKWLHTGKKALLVSGKDCIGRTTGFQGVILELVIVAMSVIVYYPFFKIADKQALANENKEA